MHAVFANGAKIPAIGFDTYENLAVFDFEIREDEMAVIQTLATSNSRIVNPVGLAPAWDAS